MSGGGHARAPDTATATETYDCSGASESEEEREEREEREFVFKVVVVGEYGVGKTSLVRRLATVPKLQPPVFPLAGEFCPPVTPTVGTDFFSRVVRDVAGGKHVRLQFWDTAGLERYAAVHAATYRNASAALLVFDVSDARSLEKIFATHLPAALRHCPELAHRGVVVVANKSDLFSAPKEDASAGGGVVAPDDVRSRLLATLPSAHYCEVSARTNAGVEELLRLLCRVLLDAHSEEERTEEPTASRPPSPSSSLQSLHATGVKTDAVDRTQPHSAPREEAALPSIEEAARFFYTSVAAVKALQRQEGACALRGGDSVGASTHPTSTNSPERRQHVDPHALTRANSHERRSHANNAATLGLVDTSVERTHVNSGTPSFDESFVGSSSRRRCPTHPPPSPPLSTSTAPHGSQLADRLRAIRDGGAPPQRSPGKDTALEDGDVYSSLDSGEFQRRIDEAYRRVEENTANGPGNGEPLRLTARKKKSKVKFSKCCEGGKCRGKSGCFNC